MRKNAKLHLILLPVLVLMLAFFVSVAEARGGSFVIVPMQERVENVYLGVTDSAVGNLSVVNGSHIDFLINDPDGKTVQSFLNVSNVHFNLVAEKTGNYSMLLNNTYQTFDLAVELHYGVNMSFHAQVGIKVSSSAGLAQVTPSIPTTPPEPDDDSGPTDNVFKPYSNFLKASEILQTTIKARTILPISDVALVALIVSSAGMVIILSTKTRRPDSIRAQTTVNS